MSMPASEPAKIRPVRAWVVAVIVTSAGADGLPRRVTVGGETRREVLKIDALKEAARIQSPDHTRSIARLSKPDRVFYDLGSTTLVTTQRCLPILRSRVNPSFS
jgi:hypothetical protein